VNSKLLSVSRQTGDCVDIVAHHAKVRQLAVRQRVQLALGLLISRSAGRGFTHNRDKSHDPIAKRYPSYTGRIYICHLKPHIFFWAGIQDYKVLSALPLQ
jgi:hypothetical protein